MTKHTSGPWKIHLGYFQNVADIRDAAGRMVAVSVAQWPMSMEHADANTWLIAAAPELLSALKGLLGHVKNLQRQTTEFLIPDSPHTDEDYIGQMLVGLDGPEQRAVQSAAERAIAKATGSEDQP